MGHLGQDLSCLADIQCLEDQGPCPDWGQCFFIFKHTQKWSWPHILVTHRGHQHGWSLALALHSTPGLPAPPGLAGRRSLVQQSDNTLQVYEHVHGAPSACLVPLPQPWSPLSDPCVLNLLAGPEVCWWWPHVSHLHQIWGEQRHFATRQIDCNLWTQWTVVLLQQPALIPPTCLTHAEPA